VKAEQASKQAGLKAGCNAYLTKPIKVSNLTRTIERTFAAIDKTARNGFRADIPARKKLPGEKPGSQASIPRETALTCR